MIDSELLKDCFRDTMECCRKDPLLQLATKILVANTRLYPEGFVSGRRREKRQDTAVSVRSNTTFRCASALVAPGKRTAVLNFANAYTPGGGVERGAMAQEECLCRSSNLYISLMKPEMQQEYYLRNFWEKNDLGTDRIIWSEGVTVFKDDTTYPEMLEQWFTVDVITCAAPYYDRSKKHPVTRERLAQVFRSRIRNILETAMDRDVDNLVLGAFGCGAFHNPPELVSEVFRQLLVEEGYGKYFETVVFAIKTTAASRKNLTVFRECFTK